MNTNPFGGKEFPSPTVKDLQKTFPKGVKVPEKLARLIADQVLLRYGAPFEFPKCYNGLEYFNHDAELASKFAIFGNESDGSLYAFWLYEGCAIEDAPVVFLDSEGDESIHSLVAKNLDAFLSLWVFGGVNFGPYASWVRGKKNEKDPLARDPNLDYSRDSEVGTFEKWMKDELGIVEAKSFASVVLEARQRFPDLVQWLNEQYKLASTRKRAAKKKSPPKPKTAAKKKASRPKASRRGSSK